MNGVWATFYLAAEEAAEKRQQELLRLARKRQLWLGIALFASLIAFIVART